MKESYQKHLDLSNEFRKNIPEYPKGKYSGRGIVILAGGEKYFTGGWVVVHMLRKFGCTLPIEMWHLGDAEMDDRMRELIEPLGVTTVDALKVRKEHPVRALGGWECTPFCLLYSQFEEVIFFDADNVPIVDPTFLFDTPQYKETGAIFWPDFNRLKPDRCIWKICNVPYRDECEFESGQIVVDKHRCWDALQLTMHINEYSDFYYKHIHGDKETFHMAWRMLDQEYSMPTRGIDRLKCTMCQHDFDGKRIFQHRNMDKWLLHGGNIKIKGFLYEDQCLEYVRDLRSKWDGRVRMPEPSTPEGHRLKQLVIDERLFVYHRVNIDKRDIEFLPDGLIGKGNARLERCWYIKDDEGDVELVVTGDGVTFTAKRDGGRWKGKWVVHERMPIELIPIETEKSAGDDPIDVIRDKLTHKRFIYVRVGFDKRVISLGAGGLIVEGIGGLERYWWLKQEDGQLKLSIGQTLGEPICELSLDKGGVWRGQWLDHEKMDIELIEVPA